MDKDDYESLPTNSVAVHMTAGAVAGIMEHCIMYPFDSVKVYVSAAVTPRTFLLFSLSLHNLDTVTRWQCSSWRSIVRTCSTSRAPRDSRAIRFPRKTIIRLVTLFSSCFPGICIYLVLDVFINRDLSIANKQALDREICVTEIMMVIIIVRQLWIIVIPILLTFLHFERTKVLRFYRMSG